MKNAGINGTPYRRDMRHTENPPYRDRKFGHVFKDWFSPLFTAEAIMKRVGIYLRVSTNGQTTENQRRELEAVAARSGWQVVGIYEDAGISGAKGRDQRPGLDRLLQDATSRKINMIAAWSVDRLGRSLQDLVGFLTELQALGCHLYLHQQALDTSTPSGRAMFQMLGVFAEFERGIIRERVNSGLARAKAKGVKLGRGNKKDGKRSADEKRWGMTRTELEKRILRLYKGGTGKVKIGKTLGIGTGLVQQVVTEQPRPFDVDVTEAAFGSRVVSFS
jgi:DNA invertase Pin-like site-specific DNA recombinase